MRAKPADLPPLYALPPPCRLPGDTPLLTPSQRAANQSSRASRVIPPPALRTSFGTRRDTPPPPRDRSARRLGGCLPSPAGALVPAPGPFSGPLALARLQVPPLTRPEVSRRDREPEGACGAGLGSRAGPPRRRFRPLGPRRGRFPPQPVAGPLPTATSGSGRRVGTASAWLAARGCAGMYAELRCPGAGGCPLLLRRCSPRGRPGVPAAAWPRAPPRASPLALLPAVPMLKRRVKVIP